MALPPIDLSPFRTLVDFLFGGYFALVSHMGEARATTGGSGINGRVSFVECGISGEFGIFFGVPWELPDGAAPTEAYGYQVFAGNSLVPQFGSLMLVNIGKVIAAYPDQSRTHMAFDYIFKARESNPGFLRCDVYRGPPLADVVAHLDSGQIYRRPATATTPCGRPSSTEGKASSGGSPSTRRRSPRLPPSAGCGSAFPSLATTTPRSSS